MERIVKALRINTLKKKSGGEETINQIINVKYIHNREVKQNNANQCAAVIRKMKEILQFDEIADVMAERSCCKSGKRLADIRSFVKENESKALEEKIILLAEVQYMGRPALTKDGCITTNGCAGTWRSNVFRCSCWALGERVPQGETMPAEYCLCCGGHFKFYYQKALGLKLKIVRIENSAFIDATKPCSFLYKIV
jgi:hypothetical protein